MRALILSVLALTLLSACSGDSGEGKPFRGIGPEQSSFLVTPADPLEIPAALTLPTPTPGGANRATQ